MFEAQNRIRIRRRRRRIRRRRKLEKLVNSFAMKNNF
jgi:hypothetical protein